MRGGIEVNRVEYLLLSNTNAASAFSPSANFFLFLRLNYPKQDVIKVTVLPLCK